MVNSAGNFYSRVYDTAKSLGATDTQAHLAAAQASQETGYGQHVVGNNYFGIKAPSTAANAINAQTQESVNGQMVNTNASFRSFKSLEDAVSGYMQTMATNFPDAWNAPTFDEAVSHLDNGTMGTYATDPHYQAKVSNIANKYGEDAQAASVSGDPLQAALTQPYTANGLTNGITSRLAAFAAPEAVTSQAIAPTGVDPAFGANGFLQGTPQTLGGLISTPAQNNFGDMAAAGPISAPMDVSATGQMKASTQTPGFANVGLLGVAPTADNMAGLGLEASAAAQPASFDASRFGDVPSTQSFDTARFGDVAPTSFDAARFGAPNAVQQAMATPTAINPSQPAMNSFADMAAASPISATPDTGITSAAFQGLADQAKQNLASMQAANPTGGLISSYQAPTTQNNNSFSSLASAGQLADYDAQKIADATNTIQSSGLLSGYQPTAAVPAGIAAINSIAAPSSSLLSGTPIANVANLSMATPTGLLSQPSLPSSFQASNVAPDDSQSLGSIPGMDVSLPSTVNIAQDPTLSGPTSMPALDTVSVPDQPTIAGPATTEAATQQQQQQSVTSPSSTGVTGSGTGTRGLLGGLVNKGTLTGGLLGGVLGGPLGALAGGLLGNTINNNGGLSGMFGGQPMNINNIGTGLANTSSVWGGAPMGTQATANDGQHVTSLGNGWTAITNANGVTTSFGPNNLHASYFGPSLTGGRTPGTPGGGGSGGYT